MYLNISQDIPSGSAVKINIPWIRYPPSNSKTYMMMYLLNSANMTVNYASLDVSGFTFASLNPSGMKSSNGLFNASQSGSFEFSVHLTNPLPYTGFFVIQVPSGFSVKSPTISGGTNCANPSLKWNTTDSTLTVYGCVASNKTMIADGSTITFNITGFTNPTSNGTYYWLVNSYEMIDGKSINGIGWLGWGIETKIYGAATVSASSSSQTSSASSSSKTTSASSSS